MRRSPIEITLAGACIALGLAACRSVSSQAATEVRPPAPVHAAPVRLYTPESGERYSASLGPDRQITLSFRVAGFVQSIYGSEDGTGGRRLEPGALIPKGTVLATLRVKDYEIPIQQAHGQLETAQRTIEIARAAVNEAEAYLAKADATWRRSDLLFQSRALTAPDEEAAKAQRDIAVAHLASARSQVAAAMSQETSAAANLSSMELAKTDTVLVAPYTARLLQRSIEVGSLVSAGQPAFTLADTTSVKAVFGVPDSSVAAVKTGDRIPLTVESTPGALTGVVTSIAASADLATRLYTIEATIPNPGGTLRPGMIATVHLRATRAAAEPVTVVPLSAIVRSKSEAGGFVVMVVRENRVRSHAVSLAGTYGDMIAVSGVQPGELVVSSGASLLAEGDRVEVMQ